MDGIQQFINCGGYGRRRFCGFNVRIPLAFYLYGNLGAGFFFGILVQPRKLALTSLPKAPIVIGVQHIFLKGIRGLKLLPEY